MRLRQCIRPAVFGKTDFLRTDPYLFPLGGMSAESGGERVARVPPDGVAACRLNDDVNAVELGTESAQRRDRDGGLGRFTAGERGA